MDFDDPKEAMNVLKKPKDFLAIFALEKALSDNTLFTMNPSQRKGQVGLAALSLG